MTMIARVADGLPLAASIQEDEQVTNTINTGLIFLGGAKSMNFSKVHYAWYIHSYFRWERILWIINNRQRGYSKR